MFSSLVSKTSHCYHTTLFEIDSYKQRLYNKALDLKFKEQSIKDQSFSCVSFSFEPKTNHNEHILLLGGMGPLVGVTSMIDIMKKNSTNHPITLYQSCKIPNRKEFDKVPNALLTSLINALDNVKEDRVKLVILCNSAHYFLDDVLGKLKQKREDLFYRVELYSLRSSIEEYLLNAKYKSTSLLQTDFAHEVKLYSSLHNYHLFFKCDHVQRDINRAITSVKAFEEEKIVQYGESVFNELEKVGIERVIAGCTEIPIIISALKKSSSKKMKEYLGKLDIVDPFELVVGKLKVS